MQITIGYQPTEVTLEEVLTNFVDVKLQVKCRDLGGHFYLYGDCTRCGHVIETEADCVE
jgi:hypothetical protein